jgi:bifunctional ADP-heptose synthase (sugar kinase/adenylyltransferase)
MYHVATSAHPNPESDIVPAFRGDLRYIQGGASNVVENIFALGVGTYYECPLTEVKYRVVDPVGQLVARFDAKANIDKFNVVSPLALGEWLHREGTYLTSLVVADYAKGTLTAGIIEALACYPWQAVYIDTKRNPDLYLPLTARFGHVCAFLPNRQEWEEYTLEYNMLATVVRTEGEGGVSMLAYGHEVLHLPSVATEVVSVCGAGDTVTAAVVAARHKGLGWEQSLKFAMKCAAQVVNQPLTAVVKGGDILLEDLVQESLREVR